ncbi:MAG: glycosyltransferase [Lachnospiraceae bacterium]|nr:glycosyltransferase [Lachnospiraceae bacterium]
MSVAKKIGTACRILVKEGPVALGYKTLYKINYNKNSSYKVWIEHAEKNIMKTEKLEYNPLISVVIPVYNVSERILSECIDSVLNQTYKNFELCMADDCSTMASVKKTLKKYEDNEKVKIVYRKENGHISKATNSAIEVAEGEFVAFMDCDDTIAPNALFEVVKKLNEDKTIDFIYSDEDKLTDDSKHRENPFFKPDWSPDTFMTSMYTCHLGVYRKSIGDELGWLRSEFDGAQDYDFTMRFTEKTKNIAHIPKILYHWRMIEGSTAANPHAKEYVNKATIRLKEEALKRRGLEGEVELVDECFQYRVKYTPTGNPLVSIIIPSKDNFEVYKRCIDSMVEKTTYKNYEIITVDNGSNDANKAKYEKYCASLPIHCEYHHKKMEFNFSKMCNIGAEKAHGKLFLFLNDDMEIIHGDWLERMAGHAMLDYIGAVGAKLIYHDSTYIQHIGVVSMPIGPVHIFCQENDENIMVFNRNRIDYNYSAVTAACLMVDKDKFNEIGGFDETFKVAYNDVKLCFDLLAKGYYNVCKMDVKLYHYESLSRGYDTENSEKMIRLVQERKRLYSYYPELQGGDPFYNINLTNDNDDFAVNAKENKAEFTLQKVEKPKLLKNTPANIKAVADNISYQGVMDHKIRISGWYVNEKSMLNNITKPDLVLWGKNNTYRLSTKKLYRENMDSIAHTKKTYNLSSFYTYLESDKIEPGEYRLFLGKGEKFYYAGQSIDIEGDK